MATGNGLTSTHSKSVRFSIHSNSVQTDRFVCLHRPRAANGSARVGKDTVNAKLIGDADPMPAPW